MPEMNGYEATEEIRRREGMGRRVPIIALTASAIKGDDERCFAAGMDAYVTKPVTVDALGSVLAGLIDRGEEGPHDAVLDKATLESLWLLGGGASDFLEEVAETFIQGVPGEIEVLKGAVARHDLAAAAEAAHRLKGSCLAVGAVAMSGLADAMEHAAIENRADGLDAPAAQIDRLFEDVRDALRAAAGVPSGRTA